MDEVDTIILQNLRAIGTSINDDVVRLKDISPANFVEGCARCINIIRGKDELQTVFPSVMSARFRVGTDLANACQELGWKSKIGYNTFLYINEVEARQLLMWLIERLPKEAARAQDETLGSAALLYRVIGSELQKQSKLTWTPRSSKKDGIFWSKDKTFLLQGAKAVNHFEHVALSLGHRDIPSYPNETTAYQKRFQPVINVQPLKKSDFNASVLHTSTRDAVISSNWEIEWNQTGIKSGLSQKDYRKKKQQQINQKTLDKVRAAFAHSDTTRPEFDDFIKGFAEISPASASTSFAHKEKLQFSKESAANNVSQAPTKASEEELKKQREEEEAALQAQVDAAQAQIEELEARIKKYLGNISKLDTRSDELRKDLEDKEESKAMREAVLALLPNADENIAKNQQAVDDAASRLVIVAKRWEEVRSGLVDTYRRAKGTAVSNKGNLQRKLEQIAWVREQATEVTSLIKTKETVRVQLAAETEQMRQDKPRSYYTERILDSIDKINKQRAEIEKIRNEYIVISKEISQLAEKRNRIFAVTDEKIFKQRADEGCRNAYRQLAALHESTEVLLNSADEMGRINREIRTLEDQIDVEKKKEMGKKLADIQKDFEAIKEENLAIEEQIRALKAK